MLNIFQPHTSIVRLRAGCPDLEFRIGRWHGTYTCKLCSDGIKDEFHFLFHCSKLEPIRYNYLNMLEIDGDIMK